MATQVVLIALLASGYPPCLMGGVCASEAPWQLFQRLNWLLCVVRDMLTEWTGCSVNSNNNSYFMDYTD